jgi:hypothetical protein
VEVVDNQLPRSRGLTSLSCDEKFNLCREGANPGPYNGALNSALLLRRNTLSDGQGISLRGTTSDVVVEANSIKQPIEVANTTDHVVLRANRAGA